MNYPLNASVPKRPAKMIFAKALLCAAFAPLLLATHAIGAVITWGTAQTIDPNDASTVSTAGSLVTAFNMNPSATTTTINGVNFTDYQHASGVSGLPTALINNTWFYSGAFPTTPAYAALLGYQFAAWDGIQYGTSYSLAYNPIVLSGLIDGQSYQIQVWTPYSGGSAAAYWNTRFSDTAPGIGTSGDEQPFSVSLTDSPTLTLGVANGTVGSITANPQYLIGTFTATGTTQSLWFHGDADSPNNYVGEIGALQLRYTPVPEPATVTLLSLGGLLALVMRRKFRRREVTA